GVLIALLAGTNRREVRARDAEAREAIRQAAVAREEQNRAQTLADRQQLAREIHDVLAHSLGGLVIQLDAAEAQFEAGAVDAVLARLRDARAMAADGLTEARHAVEALRTDPGAASPGDRAPSVNGQQVAAAIAELAEAHTRLGSAVMLRSEGDASALSERTATALRRAAQESLSNARKHAPDAPVRMELVWSAGTVELSVRNPLEAENRTSRLAGSGSGRGIAGMRERFATIPGGSVEAGPIADEFVVRVTASTEGAAR
ncbi:MAG: two-component sensor histidine kinase, partial [Actinobacteria bacterium]|nr:two-component sensor histidine kinase [Actinomycetota bacterium]